MELHKVKDDTFQKIQMQVHLEAQTCPYVSLMKVLEIVDNRVHELMHQYNAREHFLFRICEK